MNTSEREPFNDTNDSKQSDNKCRICLESTMSKLMSFIQNSNYYNEKNENILINPCNCKSEHKNIHLSCLKKWLKCRPGSQILQNNNSILFSYPNQCEICKGFFPDVIQYKEKFYDIADFIEINFDNYITFEIIPNNSIINNVNCKKQFLILKLIKNKFYYIGKGEKNHFIFNDQDMSYNQCKIYMDNSGNVYINDFKSITGTFIKMNGAIELYENNVMHLQNKNTYIQLKLISKNKKKCCLYPRKNISYPIIYFTCNNLNLNLNKIFDIKYNYNDNNYIIKNNKKTNSFSPLIASSNNTTYTNNLIESNELVESTSNVLEEQNNSNIKNKNNYCEKNISMFKDENINPNITYKKKDNNNNLYKIHEYNAITNNRIVNNDSML